VGFFYFDESIHQAGKFSLGAFAYSETELGAPVNQALIRSGLIPFIDEFKSSAHMDGNPKQALLRDQLRIVLRENCRIGLVIAPDQPRELLGSEAFLGLNKILSTNQFKSASHDVFFDQGMFGRGSTARRKSQSLCLLHRCKFHFEQDSKQVLGLQVADLIAHTCAIMLMAQRGFLRKTVKAGQDSGYDPELDIELDFELWASVRWNFFAAAPPPPELWESQLDFQVEVESRGLHVAAACSPELTSAAIARFGRMYLGCIH
jgi:hypothetical protein